MFLYPLIISILAVMNPFLGVVVLLLDTNPGTQLMALDAIFAVGGVSMVFLYMLKRGTKLSDSFLVATLVVIAYGFIRSWLFGAYQLQVFDQGLEMMKAQFPTMVDNAMFTDALPIWKAVLPSVWIVTQGAGFALGFLLFQRVLKFPSVLSSFSFPGIYNLLIIAILPLYLFEHTKMLFLNALLALCIIPFLQGISVVWQRLSLVFANRLVLGIFMIVIILYTHILLVLLGFADMWLNKRKEIPGGITA